MQILILLASLVAVSSAQVIGFGKCPKYQVFASFNSTKYFTGRWYEQKRFWTVFEVGASCVNADYTLKPDGHVIVNNSGYRAKTGRDYAIGDAYCDSNRSAVCYVKFSQVQPVYGNYNVLATDYTGYGLVYSCGEMGLLHSQYAWILTRNKTVSAADMAHYLDIFVKNGVDIKQFRDVPQNCKDN